MKLFKWFTNRSGKFALSALQTAGLATVVGVAGLGAWNMLSTPQDEQAGVPSYNPGEVVYVAGNPTGGAYQRGNYAGAGDSQAVGNESSMQVTARTITRLENSAQQERSYEEMERQYQQNMSSSVPQTAAPTGVTEGLGMGANDIDPKLLQSDPMAAMSQQMGQMKGMISQLQNQANTALSGQVEQAAAAGKSSGVAGVAQLQKAGLATARGGSSGSSNAFVIQNSGKNKGDTRAGGVGSQNAGDIFAAAQQQVARSLEGAAIRGKSSFGPTNGLNGSLDSSISDGGRVSMSKAGADLDWIARRSRKDAATRTRAANEGSRAFLGSEQVSGGMRFVGENVTTGQGQGSKDFDTDHVNNLKGIKSWANKIVPEQLKRDKDRHDVQAKFWTAFTTALLAVLTIPYLKKIKWFGVPILALAAAAYASYKIYKALEAAIDYAKDFGGTSLSTWCGIGAVMMLGAVWGSFFFASKMRKVLDKVQEFLHLKKPPQEVDLSKMSAQLEKAVQPIQQKINESAASIIKP